MLVGDLVRWRSQMGRAIQGLGQVPGARTEVSEEHWLWLSGAPSPDANVVLVHRPDRAVLDHALAAVAQHGAPALLCLAGDADDRAVPEGWQPVGTMPFMRAQLAHVPLASDPRVRVAGPEDVESTVALLSDAFGMAPEVARTMVEPVLTGAVEGVRDMRFWLLHDDGAPVSAVLDARTGDALTVWCMGTPERWARRGYARALLAHMLHDAREAGLAVGLLGATPAGKPLYDATGWQTLEEWRLFVRVDQAH